MYLTNQNPKSYLCVITYFLFMKHLDLSLNLKDYAVFLLENHLDDLIEEGRKRAEEIRLPLLKFYSYYTEQELYEFNKKSYTYFLKNLADGKGLDEVKESIRLWKSNELPGIPKDQISVKDIALAYSIRKYALLKLFPLYNQNVIIITALALELEDFFLKVNELTLEAYIEFQRGKFLK